MPNSNYLERIRRNTERLARLIADLLDLSRTEAGRIEFRPEAMRLADLVRDVLADRDRTHQILMNLVGNALKFTPAGGRKTVRDRVAPGYTRLRGGTAPPGSPESPIGVGSGSSSIASKTPVHTAGTSGTAHNRRPGT